MGVICQITQAGVVVVRPIAAQVLDWSAVEAITFCVRSADQNIGSCSDDM
jgi:hypothetical protein